MTTGTLEVQERFKSALPTAPLNRMGQPQEIADVCLFLCGSKATFVQGAAWVSTYKLRDIGIHEPRLKDTGCGWRLHYQLKWFRQILFDEHKIVVDRPKLSFSTILFFMAL